MTRELESKLGRSCGFRSDMTRTAFSFLLSLSDTHEGEQKEYMERDMGLYLEISHPGRGGVASVTKNEKGVKCRSNSEHYHKRAVALSDLSRITTRVPRNRCVDVVSPERCTCAPHIFSWINVLSWVHDSMN